MKNKKNLHRQMEVEREDNVLENIAMNYEASIHDRDSSVKTLLQKKR